MSLVTRLSRFGIFTKTRPPTQLGTDVQLQAKKGVENEKPSDTSTKDATQLPSDVAGLETVQPSYFGYLSGVVSSLWSPAQQDGQVSSVNPPAKEKRTMVLVRKTSRAEVVQRTRVWVERLLKATTDEDTINSIENFNNHLTEFPASRVVAVQRFPELVGHLLKHAKRSNDDKVKGLCWRCLALVGYVRPPKAAGIRVLSVDGGGTRGMMGLEVLAELEKNLGSKVCDHFDLICGVSTGAIISVLLGAKRMKVREAKEIYMDISRQLFNQGKLSGVSGLLLSHSYYNTKKWVEILKTTLGTSKIIDTAQTEDAVKIAIISCVVNAPQLQPFVFRNYDYPAGRDSHFRGGTQFHLWQAIQASAAAPGYFEEVSLGTVLHQDGGVLANNPTAIALHEARLLWPNEGIQCVVSVGNGRTVAELELTSILRNTGIQDKISKIVDSATDTELIHNAMADLLPAHTYFRLNPYMTFPYTLDEIDPNRLDQMGADARSYVRRNRQKILDASLQLKKPASLLKLAKRSLNYVRTISGKYVPE